MSEDTPRLSRRQMREQGLLDAPAATPPVYDTTELRLRRPSRKELRELAERAAQEQTRDESTDVGEPTQAMEAVQVPAEPTEPVEPVHHERKSVFDRFEADEPEVGAHKPADAAEAPAPGGVTPAEAGRGGTDAKPADEPAPVVEPAPADGADDDEDYEDSLRDRFLAMTKRETEAGAEETKQDEPKVAAPVATKAQAEPANQEETAESTPDTEVEAPRRTWLNFIILILIAALVGYLGGSWINVTFLSEPLTGVVNDLAPLLL